MAGELLAIGDTFTERVTLRELLCDFDIRVDCVTLLERLGDTLADLLRVG